MRKYKEEAFIRIEPRRAILRKKTQTKSLGGSHYYGINRMGSLPNSNVLAHKFKSNHNHKEEENEDFSCLPVMGISTPSREHRDKVRVI